MPKKKTTYCNSRSVGRLLADAQRGVLIGTGREEDRRVFFDDHMDECRACRDAMIDHANQFALSEIAEESSVEVEVVVERLGEVAKQMSVIAHDTGVSFEEVVARLLRGRLSGATNLKSSRALLVAAPTET